MNYTSVKLTQLEYALEQGRPLGTLFDSVESSDTSLHARDMGVRSIAKLSNTVHTLPYLEYIHG